MKNLKDMSCSFSNVGSLPGLKPLNPQHPPQKKKKLMSSEIPISLKLGSMVLCNDPFYVRINCKFDFIMNLLIFLIFDS